MFQSVFYLIVISELENILGRKFLTLFEAAIGQKAIRKGDFNNRLV